MERASKLRMAPRSPERVTDIEHLLMDGWARLLPAYQENRMTEDELLAIARDKFFWPYDSIASRWEKITAVDLRRLHTAECWSDHLISYSGGNAEASAAKGDELDLWLRLADLARRGMPPGHLGIVRAQLKQHQAVCGICNAHHTRLSAHIQIEWAGFTLAREYALRRPTGTPQPSTPESPPP